MPLIQHPSGDYFFLPGIAPYSCGVVSMPGFEIVGVRFQSPLPYRAGFDRIAKLLESVARPQAAVCAISLRSPRPFTFAEFAEFNGQYTEILNKWGVFVDGVNPIARTNVAPVIGSPIEPILYGFSYARPCEANVPTTFVVAGGGELPEGVLAREGIVGLGNRTISGLRQKAIFVMDLMENRLQQMGTGWTKSNMINVYTAFPLTSLLPDVILARLGAASVHSIHWYYSRPPIEEIDFEMDVRGTRSELVV